MAPPRTLRRQNPKIGEDCEFQRTDIFRHFIRLAGRFSEIWQSIKQISKNRSYTLKILEFHVESPEGNKIKEIPNFKETSFFDMSSAQPDRFRAVFNCFPIVVRPFSDRFGPFRTVFAPFFFRFFASWRRGAAAEASQRRRCAVAAPPLEIFNAGPPPANSQSILFRNLLGGAGMWIGSRQRH